MCLPCLQVVPLVLELTQHVANRMAQHASFDVTDAAKRITSDVMGQLLYGEDLRGVHWEPSEYLDTLDNVLKAETALVRPYPPLWHAFTLRKDTHGLGWVCHVRVQY